MIRVIPVKSTPEKAGIKERFKSRHKTLIKADLTFYHRNPDISNQQRKQRYRSANPGFHTAGAAYCRTIAK